jgi:predicted transcriptional regulator
MHNGREPASGTQDGAMPTPQNYRLRLDAGRRAKLEDIAMRKDRDLSYVIRKAIDEYIERHQDDPKEQ